MSEVLNKKISSLAWPIFVELVLGISLLITDTVFLSRISDHAASAISAAIPILSVCLFFFQAFAGGGGSVAAQYLGANRKSDAAAVYTASLLLNLLLGTVLSLVFWFFHARIAASLGFSNEPLRYVSVYLGILGSAMIVQAFKSFYASIIASMGKTFWNTVTCICANLINIGLNYCFLTGWLGFPRAGVTGVALATVLSNLVSVGIAGYIVHGRLNIKLSFSLFWQAARNYLGSILGIALPSALEPLSYQLFQVCTSVMVIHLGTITLGARAYAFNLAYANFVWYYTIALAAQILISHLVGARLYERADRLMATSLKQGVWGSLIITTLTFLTARITLSLYTRNPDIIQLGTAILAIGILYGVFSAANTIISFALRAAGDAKYTSMLGIVIMWLIGVPFCYILGIGLGLGIMGVVTGMTIEEGVRVILNYRRWKQRYWEHTGVTALAESTGA